MTPYEVWQRGMTLAEVVEGSEAGRQWLAKRAHVLEDCHRLQIDPRSPLFDRIESITRLQALAGAWEEQKRLLEEAREGVRQRLCSGDLLACGFVGGDDQPQQLAPVPPELWHYASTIDWDSGGVAGHARRFVDVRVFRRSRQQERLDSDAMAVPFMSDDPE